LAANRGFVLVDQEGAHILVEIVCRHEVLGQAVSEVVISAEDQLTQGDFGDLVRRLERVSRVQAGSAPPPLDPSRAGASELEKHGYLYFA
jgi:hypothetical protein